MQLLITISTTLLAGALVILVPGAALLGVLRLGRFVPAPLVPAAALAIGLVPLIALTAATLALRQPIEWIAIALAALTIACWVALARRAGRAADDTGSSRARARVREWLVPPRDLVAGRWARETPRTALLLALAGGIVALLVGFYAWNDSLYHIGQAQKLLALDAPSFTNTLQFPDASAHPGYLIPAWHEAIALTALVARVDPVVAAWVLPGLTVPIGTLAIGGLGWALTRARGAATVTAAAWLVTMLAALPYADPIINAMHPGAIAIYVIVPLVLAMLLTALWPPSGTPTPRDDEQPPAPPAPAERTTTRGAVLLAAIGVLEVGVLHVGYLWVLGMGVLGYFLAWALRAPWPRAVVRRHLVTGLAVALVAGAMLALLLPGLSQLEGLGRDAQAELAANDSIQYEGENGANLDALLRGDPDGAFHLRSDYLVAAGGLALLGLLSIPLTLLAPRWPGSWYLVGAATLVVAIATSDRLFPGFVELVTLDQARRIERVLPLTLGLAVGALAIGAAAVALWRRGGAGWRVLGGLLAVAATVGVMAAVNGVPPLEGYGGPRTVHPRVIVVVLVLLLVGAGVQLVLLGLRLLRRRPRPAGRLVATWTWPTRLLGAGATAVATCVLLVGSWPVYANVDDVRDATRLDRLPVHMRTAEARLFSPRVAAVLRDLPAGSVVLADPRTRNPYVAMALAPVYVVSSVPRHTALTPENRVDERFDAALSFFDGGFDTHASLAERVQLLRDERVDAIVMHPAASNEIRDQLEVMPGIRPAARGKNQVVYLVDRAGLLERSASAIAVQRPG